MEKLASFTKIDNIVDSNKNTTKPIKPFSKKNTRNPSANNVSSQWALK